MTDARRPTFTNRAQLRPLWGRCLAPLLVLLLSSCGYHLVDMTRTVHLALSAEGPMHPDALPEVQHALADRLRGEGLRLSPDAAEAELDVVVSGAQELAALPAQDETGAFVPSAWDARLTARATLRRTAAENVELGTFESSGMEATGSTAAADDVAQASAYAAAARMLAERIVAAVLAAW
jgi:hypothetical protein